MIIWHGLGGVIAAITFVVLLVADLATQSYFNDSEYFKNHSWPIATGFFISAFLTFLFVRYLASRPSRTMIDKETQQEVIWEQRHALFFINVKYWPFILATLGIIIPFCK